MGIAATDAAATAPAQCPVSATVARNGIPDWEKRWCDSQHQTLINECTNRFHDDNRRVQQCYADANQWYADCLAGKHLHYMLADAVPAPRLRQ
ncbi:hypothetical protein GZH49_01645 [Nocardia terpenica]|uniref:hypothetical protein n=1 Tax=Nocardia terpenica TaxID=455432 RepID=UPI002FE22246